jgi:hypothetical protein
MKFFRGILKDISRIDRSRDVLRKFGLLLMGVLLVIAGMIWFKHRNDATGIPVSAFVFLFCAFAALIMSLAKPAGLKPVNTAMIFVSMIIGWFVTRIILVILYAFIFVPIGFFLRISGRDSMTRSFAGGDATYWITRPSNKFDKERCKRLF